MAQMIGIPEIARRLKIDASSVRRFIARETDNLKLSVNRGKAEKLLLSVEDADRLIASYESRRGPISVDDDSQQSYDSFGWFYLIQLIPEALSDRIKIGFADNVERRLQEHRTAAPTAALVKCWPCKRSWDHAAMDSITREGCKLVLNEVFEGEVQGFVDRGEQFFSVMPNPDSERALSVYSPLYDAADDSASQPTSDTSAADVV